MTARDIDAGGGDDPFARLRSSTPARIGLGRSGDALPLSSQLDLLEAHARARDSVHAAVDFEGLAQELAPRPTLLVRSRAADRGSYLRRPDLGRRLREEDVAGLDALRGDYDAVFVIADGLSGAAVGAHAARMVEAAEAVLTGWRLPPLILAEQARVALGDEIGERLGAALAVVLIGERPGLTVSDSLGIYITFAPRVGRADSERNCISNVHGRGLSYGAAAALVGAIGNAARRLGRTGTALKIETRSNPLIAGEPNSDG